MLSEVVTCNCVRNPGGHAESNPRPSEEGVSFYLVLRPLDLCSVKGDAKTHEIYTQFHKKVRCVETASGIHYTRPNRVSAAGPLRIRADESEARTQHSNQ